MEVGRNGMEPVCRSALRWHCGWCFSCMVLVWNVFEPDVEGRGEAEDGRECRVGG